MPCGRGYGRRRYAYTDWTMTGAAHTSRWNARATRSPTTLPRRPAPAVATAANWQKPSTPPPPQVSPDSPRACDGYTRGIRTAQTDRTNTLYHHRRSRGPWRFAKTTRPMKTTKVTLRISGEHNKNFYFVNIHK